MMTTPILNHRLFPKIHPLSLLVQLSTRKVTGCLSVFNASVSWSIYLENGQLIYAACSDKLFERIESHLQQLNQQLSSITREQIRLIWEKPQETQLVLNNDYQVICWLVEQNHLTLAQATVLIEELCKEVLESFLCLKAGSYKFNPGKHLDELPRFSPMDLRLMVDYCGKQLHQRQNIHTIIPAIAKPEKQPDQTTGNLINSAKTQQPTITSVYTIACIDDSLTVLKSIRHFLDESTFSVVMINDPIKALMQVVRSKPDLILLDVEMPNLDGYELCSLLRRHSGFKNTPIVMVTGRTGFIDKAKAKIVRSSGYLTKPFTRSELLKMVTKYMR